MTLLGSVGNFAVASTSSFNIDQLVSADFGFAVGCQVYTTLARGMSAVKRGVKLPFRVMKQNMDKRTMRDLVSEAGFEHAQYDCQTEDGYIISLHRIVNKTSFNVVYF